MALPPVRHTLYWFVLITQPPSVHCCYWKDRFAETRRDTHRNLPPAGLLPKWQQWLEQGLP